MAADLVAPLENHPHEIGMRPRFPADHEERDREVSIRQQIQKPRSGERVRSVVKGESHGPAPAVPPRHNGKKELQTLHKRGNDTQEQEDA
jgi:hypothetical protein